MPQPPKLVATFFSYFPLKSYPPIDPRNEENVESRPTKPTLWISEPRPWIHTAPTPATIESAITNLLSSEVDSLKWQAYIALRGVSNLKVRWDIRPEGALEARLPNLHLPKDDGERLDEHLLPATPEVNDNEKEKNAKTPLDKVTKLYLYAPSIIPSWVDLELGVDSNADPLEGYISEAARDESRAWVSLLEGAVRGALILFGQEQRSFLSTILAPIAVSAPEGSAASAATPPTNPLQTVLSPPPAPLSGFTSLLPAFGARVSHKAVLSQYRDAIASLAERLGTDKWFLGSRNPTSLDALAFAHLHCLLESRQEILRVEVTKQVNLVAWEWRVRQHVREAYVL